MKRISFALLLSLLALLVCHGRLNAYSQRVHQRITREVINQNVGKLNKYIIDYIGLTNGVREQINKKRISTWIENGSWWEDFSLNPKELLTSHFHNPLTNKGLTEFGVTIGESAYDRANNPNNYWSWPNARDLIYKGLTSTTKSEREKALADSFEALGHLMHLVQDMAVPAHTRDDMHGLWEPYEVFTDVNMDGLYFTAEPFPYWNVSISPSAPKQFWDLDSYNGEIAYDSGYIGLSEYTNANFLSKSTIFKEDTFPHPSRENTNFSDFGLIPISVITTPDKINHNTFYISGYGKTHLAALKYFAEEIWNLPVELPWKKYKLTAHLDNRCHEEYAGDLIPRAVGYSAGLLDYFFRGQLQISALPIFYKNGIQYVRVKIKNMTPNETMENGYFVLTYQYRPTDGPPDGSKDKFGIAWYNTDTSFAPCTKLESGKDMTIDFIIDPTIPIANYNSVKFTLAYRGTLGNEKANVDGTGGAVIGKVFTPGEIKFGEEWDNGLNGNHNWAHTDFSTSQDYQHGTSSNIIEGDTLIKENIRFAGYKNAKANGSFIGVEPLYPGHEDVFPILITPKTSLQFKIDKMSINHIPPAPPGYTNHYQGLYLYFNNGLVLQLTQDGQGVLLTPTTATWTFDLGLIFVNNIYQMFRDAGITIPEPLYLYKISFSQQLFELQDPSTVEHHQHMEIDFISIVEEKEDEVKPQQ